jgi:hypothetical protein
MIAKPYTYHTKLLTRWLLTLTMVLSLFTVSGIAGQFSQQEQKTQTELVVTANSSTLKRAVYYQLPGAHAATGEYLKPDLLNQAYLISYLNQLVKLEFDRLLVQFTVYKVHFQSHLLQITPHYSDGEGHSFFIG